MDEAVSLPVRQCRDRPVGRGGGYASNTGAIGFKSPNLGRAGRSLARGCGPHSALQSVLSHWAAADDKPLVLLIDEIDALIGDTLLAVLRQLRAGYPDRPQHYPQTVVLCGVRDVRDYRIQSTAENAIIAGGSAFNIRAESLRLGDFSPDEVQAYWCNTLRPPGRCLPRTKTRFGD